MACIPYFKINSDLNKSVSEAGLVFLVSHDVKALIITFAFSWLFYTTYHVGLISLFTSL